MATSPASAKPTQGTLAFYERLFANQVAAGTGLDPRVIYAQEQAEGAYAPGGTGGLNFLNLKTATVQSLGLPYAGSTSAGFAQFDNPNQAAQATIAEFRSPAIGITTAAPTPAGQIAQISASPWDQTHYGGGASLRTIFAQLFGTPALTAPATTKGLNVEGGGSAADAGSIDLAGAGKAAGAAVNAIPGVAQIKSISDAIGWLFNTKNILRVGEVLGGGALILVGVVMVGRAATSTGPAQQTSGAVRTVTRTRTVSRRSTAPARRAAQPRTSRQVRPGETISQSSARTRRRAGFQLPADRKPRRGEPGSRRLAKGDTIPF